MDISKEVDLVVGDYVETKNAYLEPISGTVTSIGECSFIVGDGLGNFHVVPKRYYNKNFSKEAFNHNKDLFTPKKREPRKIKRQYYER